MQIPDAFKERLLEESDIKSIVSSYVQLKNRGRAAVGLCPFHSEKTPSFHVYIDNQSFYCFGCQKGGDVITFVQEIERLDFLEAVKLLAGQAGLPLPQEADDASSRRRVRVLEINRVAARFFHATLTSTAGVDGYSYLASRGLARKTIRSFGLGFAPDSWDSLKTHLTEKGFTQDEMLDAAVVAKGKGGRMYDSFRGRVIFPIIDLRGNVIGFGGRALGEGSGPKYLNSPDTLVFKKSRGLYALNFAKAARDDKLILAEGYMDVIALHQSGFTSAVATLGTALTTEQARLISQYTGRVVIAYDSDPAGQNATRRALGVFSSLDVAVNVLELGQAKDPDEYIKKFGAARFASLLEGGKSAFEFEIGRLRVNHDIDLPEGKAAFLREFCRLMADVGGDIPRDIYISQIAREMDVSRERLADTTQAIRKKKQENARRQQAHNLTIYVQDKPKTLTKQSLQQSLNAAVAERELIALILKNPDYFGTSLSKLTKNDFSDADLGVIYECISRLISEGRPAELAIMGATLNTRQMGIVSGLLANKREIKYYREQAEEFLVAIKSHKERKSPDELGQMSERELGEYIETARRAKLR